VTCSRPGNPTNNLASISTTCGLNLISFTVDKAHVLPICTSGTQILRLVLEWTSGTHILRLELEWTTADNDACHTITPAVVNSDFITMTSIQEND